MAPTAPTPRLGPPQEQEEYYQELPRWADYNKGPGPTTSPPQGPHAEPPMDPGHLWPVGITAQTRHAARPCGMASPWETCWLRLPVNFRQALAAEDITAEVNDARIYASLWNRPLQDTTLA